MIHVTTYLPTAGKDTEYLTDLAGMKDMILELQDKIPSAAVFVRGDCNSSQHNSARYNNLARFCTLKSVSQSQSFPRRRYIRL